MLYRLAVCNCLVDCKLFVTLFCSRKAAIMDTIMQKSGITFKDVAGLTEAKQAPREAIILPTQYPHLFTGLHVQLFA